MRTLLCFFLIIIAIALQAQSLPKREMRAAWVATVANIDYPVQPSTDTAALKREWLQLLDRLGAYGLNAVFVQVRPTADALYPTQLAPWSKYLTGAQGVAPQGNFDLLNFMIQTAKQRNMEFHAWLNPYRATNDLDTVNLAPNHVFKARRNWILRYGPKFYLNPALPEVWNHLAAVVDELVTRYPIDAIHMDDYFYPYRIAGEAFPDSLDYLRFGKRFVNINDWRRHNVDTMIQILSQRIHATRPGTEFGISPFGVWRNIDKDPEGSNTRAGQTNYDDLYADVRKWLRLGWIDYVTPQIYFHIGFDLVDYDTLLRWWQKNTYGKKLYVGMGTYRIGSPKPPQWSEPNQSPRQMRLNRTIPEAQGEVFFSAKSLLNNPLGFSDSLQQNFYRRPAIWPLKSNMKVASPLPAPKLLRPKRKTEGIELRWQWDQKTANAIAPTHYVVYRFLEKNAINTSDGSGIYRIIPAEQAANDHYVDMATVKNQRYYYVLSALDAQHQEGATSKPKRSK
jgi:uncharacterized lipoprotein YddW (UPF0748 family)